MTDDRPGKVGGEGLDDHRRARIERVTGSSITETTELDGGEVGTVDRVTLADGRRFAAKTGQTPLSVEAAMLRYLGDRTDLPVPAVVHAADDLLLLEYVPGDDDVLGDVPGDGAITPAVERHLADLLAALHERSTDASGFHYDTLSGPLRQPNPWTDSWIEFFREFRLRHVADLAADAGHLPASLRERVDALASDLDALLVEPDAPALVHGDVWAGNLVVAGDRIAAVLDPALFYGHAEYDLAYARWTDTVGERFLDRYREQRELAAGAERRAEVYEILPLLEHLHYFGEQYLNPLEEALSGLGY